MAYVACELTEGLRPSEVTVSVKDVGGNKEFLRVERDFVVEQGGAYYLPIGIVFRESDKFLIELPHEADSGANRLWVRSTSILELEPERRREYA